MASYLRDRERHLKLIPCTRVHCCDQHKCPDISNQFPEDQVVHYGKYLHDLLHCAAPVWENHEGKLKLIKRHVTGDHGSFTGNYYAIFQNDFFINYIPHLPQDTVQ